MDSIKLFSNTDQYTLYPEVDQVFLTEFEIESMLPFGIFSIDIGGVKHDILIAVPIADDEGKIGRANLGERCGGTWLSYSNRGGKKWALDCMPDDLLSFHINRAPAIASFQERKKLFENYGYLPNYAESKAPAQVFELGGERPTTYENWYGRVRNYISNRLVDIPGEENEEQKFFTLIGEDGNDYVMLGTVRPGVYTKVLSYTIVHFFYNPMSKRVLVIQDFY